MLKLFLQLELGKGAKYFRTKKLAKSITGMMFMLVFLFIAIGIYLFFVAGFNYMNFNLDPSFRLPLTLFIYEIFLAVLAGVIIFSCLISSIFNLFRGEYDNWIISSPAYKMFPGLVFVKSLLRSLWPFFIVFLPAVLALYKVYNFSILSLILILLSFFLLLILLDALTLLAIIIVSSIYYLISQKIILVRFSFKGLIFILLILIAVVVFMVWKTSVNTDLVKLLKVEDTTTVVDISSISSHFYFLPTHPFALEIVSWQNGQAGEAMMNFSLMLLLSVVTVFILARTSRIFYPLWQRFQEGSFRTVLKQNLSRRNWINFRFKGGRSLAFFKKEALVSIRNPKGMLWFLFLFFIWFAQLGTSVVLSRNLHQYQTDISEKLAMIQALQFIIAVYFICSFSLRFVFPAFSLEKKTAWIFSSAPISFKKIYFGKYLFYVLFFVAIGILMSYINLSILNLPFAYAIYTMLLFASVVIFIVTLGLSLGAIYPNFETDDPEVIGTSMPGLFFTALSLIYGALGDWVLYSILVDKDISALLFFVVSTYVLIAIILASTPSLAGKRSFS